MNAEHEQWIVKAGEKDYLKESNGTQANCNTNVSIYTEVCLKYVMDLRLALIVNCNQWNSWLVWNKDVGINWILTKQTSKWKDELFYEWNLFIEPKRFHAKYQLNIIQ